MLKRIYAIVVVLMLFSQTACQKKVVEQSKVLFNIHELHSGDAKIYRNHVITQVGGKLTLIDFEGNIVKTYEDIYANWINCVEESEVLIYANFNNEVGLVMLNDDFDVVSNVVIGKFDNLMIDPAICKVNEEYFVTLTEIQGKVNNSDIDQENGLYTIKFYKLEDNNLEFISNVSSAKNNLEDVDLVYYENEFVICYEKEVVDKGSSSVIIKETIDSEGFVWGEEIELLKPDCDHEPTSICRVENGWRLYYSCDLDDVGGTYMSAKAYYAQFNNDFDLEKKDIHIFTDCEKGILWYDIVVYDDRVVLLYSKDYLTTNDLVLEEKKEIK